jgi:hypothetical protein
MSGNLYPVITETGPVAAGGGPSADLRERIAMTTELQRVMARYEDARIAYKKAVLASLNGDSSGESIRQAIREFQAASADLRRVTGAPPAPRPSTAPPTMSARVRKAPRAGHEASASVPRALAAANPAQGPSFGFALFWRLLSAG